MTNHTTEPSKNVTQSFAAFTAFSVKSGADTGSGLVFCRSISTKLIRLKIAMFLISRSKRSQISTITLAGFNLPMATAAQEWWSMMPSPRQRRLPRCLQDWGSSPRGHPQSGNPRANLIMFLMSKCWCSMCRSGRSVKQLMSVNDKSLFMGLQWSRAQGD